MSVLLINKINKFEIIGAHGDRDFSVDFAQNPLIALGENGTGKTTILTALYSVLSGNYEKLENIDFDVINIRFRKGKTLTMHKGALEQYPGAIP